MGYDVHITRSEDWTESDEAPITPDDWRAFVDAAPDLEWNPERPWSHMEVDLVVWTGHPDPDFEAWLALLDGQVETKNPDEPLRAKMYEIATALGARVQGDEGELYGPDGQQLHEDPWASLKAQPVVADEAPTQKPFLSRLFKRS